MTYYIWRGDPTASPPPSDDPTLTVTLATDDGAVVVLGSKMFGSSDVGIIGRSEQERRVGLRSYGRFGNTWRVEPSHGGSLIVGFDGIELADAVFAQLDQYAQHAVADLVFARELLISQDPDKTNTAAYLTPAAVRAL